jgi:MFS family permease
MSEPPPEPGRRSGSASGAALVGTALEWYDFSLYGTAAALVFNKIIFPTGDPVVGTLAAFGTYAVGFLARPLGAAFFGHLGDRVGRRRVLVLTLLLMGGATAGMGLIPSYDVAGLWAPILLIALRLVQGFGAGAEFGGAAVLAVEHATPHRRGLHGSWPAVGVFVGLVVASATFALLTRLPAEAFLAWGWRLPFLASIAVVAVALVLRLRLPETPDFARLQRTDRVETAPLRTAVREFRRPLLVVFGAQMGQSAISYVYITFVTAYLAQNLQMGSSIGPLATTLGAIVSLVTMPLFAALSDRIGRRPVILFGALFSAAFAFPFFLLTDTRTTAGATIAVIVGVGVGAAAMIGPQGAYFSELFPARVRLSGFAVGREVASALSGGISPLIAVALVAAAGGASWPVSVLVIAFAALSVVTVLLLGPETAPARTGGDADTAPAPSATSTELAEEVR